MAIELKLYTVEEANQVVAAVRPELERLRGWKRAFDELERRVAVMELAVSHAAPGNPDAVELEELKRRRETLENRIGRGIRGVHTHGCVLKDLNRGLVDFYSLHGDRLIFLCWQLGEPEVAHWHSLEGGFAGRQPIERSETE